MTERIFFKRPVIHIVACLVSASIGAILTVAYLQAAPIKMPIPENTSSELILRSASYVPNSLALFTLKSEPGNEKSKQVSILVAQLKVQAILPGESEVSSLRSFGHMYVGEDDLKEYPYAFSMAKREDGIICTPISTTDTEKGLRQIRNAYQAAASSYADK